MKLRALASLFVATSVFAFAGSANAQAADTSSVMGLRFEASLFNSFDPRGLGLNPRPGGDIRVGYDLPMGLTPIVGLGLRTHSTGDFDDEDKFDGGESRTDLHISAELRYYFGAHTRGLQPYVFGEFNTAIVSFGTSYPEDDEPSDAEKDANDFVNRGRGARASSVNLNAGLGMEYKFARSFAIGAKWGLGLSFAGSSSDEETIGGTELRRNGTRDTVFGTSSSIYAAFRI